MVALAFYFPSNGDHDYQDDFICRIWNERIMDYLIYVRRVSLRGIPYIKGLFMLKDESAPLPSKFEVHPISDDCIECLYRQFKEEQKMENNAMEYGHLSLA